eukprot:TRINITY_DN11004_c0_g1_i1.p1 TRINITY_DN11004_c0_g1~~TRINITY_DN11004_c0_g1_i1.p1  ORF type:complete len:568 (+),score=238.93 TRINITY_DN11004_c0_g1_i1:163-1866(+)
MYEEISGLDVKFPEGATQQQKADVLLQALKQTTLAAKIKREVKDEIIKSKYNNAGLGTGLPKLMEDMGCTVRLTNCIQELRGMGERGRAETSSSALPLPSVPELEEPLDSVAGLRKGWRNHVGEQLRRYSREHSLPFVQPRTQRTEAARHARDITLTQDSRMYDAEREELARAAEAAKGKDDANAHNDALLRMADSKAAQILTASALLKHLSDAPLKNHTSAATRITGWGMIGLEPNSPTLDELCRTYSEFEPHHRHFGVDDTRDRFVEDRTRQLNAVLKRGSIQELRGFMKCGVPMAMRRTVWKTLLNPFAASDHTTKDKREAYLHLLQHDVLKVELLVDDVIRMDLRECSNDDKYFVFDDTLEKVLLPLVHDAYCRPYMEAAMAPFAGLDSKGTDVLNAYPPSGIIPFEGLAALCAPLCFLYTDIVDVFFTFRAMFCKYWVNLQTISTKPESILTLSKLFERVVRAYNPDVVYHCISHNLRPLEVAFPWLFSAFSGYLEVEQVLHLWDRVLAYDSLHILPILAAAIFLWRGRSILQCESAQEIRSLFTDFSKIQVIPLLQFFLFA